MLTICLVIGLIVLAGISGVQVVQTQRTNRLLDSWSRSLTWYFTAQTGEDQQTEFSRTINMITDLAGQKFALTTSAAMRGMIGGNSKAIVQGLEEEAMTAEPQLALFGNLPKKLQKNPLAQMGLSMLMQRMAAGPGGHGGPSPAGPGHGGNHNSAPVKFKL